MLCMNVAFIPLSTYRCILLLSLCPEQGETNSQSTRFYTRLLSLLSNTGETNSKPTHIYVYTLLYICGQ